MLCCDKLVSVFWAREEPSPCHTVCPHHMTPGKWFLSAPFACILVSINWQVERRRPHSLPLGELPKCHQELVFCPGKWRQEIGCLLRLWMPWGWSRVPRRQAGRMLGLPNRAGALRGALVEVEVSCMWCWSVQLLPPDRSAGQCCGLDSELMNNSRLVKGQLGSGCCTGHLLPGCWLGGASGT